jgi:chromosome segregation ATPase
MPKLIYDVELKIDQASIAGLKNIVDASTTGEVTKLTEKIERLESQLDKLKGTNQKVSKSTKQFVSQSKQKTAAVRRDEAIVKRALQTNQLHDKSVQDAVKRLQQETIALDSLSNEMTQASVSTKRNATSQEALARQATNTASAITRANSTLQQFNQQVNRSQKGFQGSNKEFAIANQTLFGFGDLAQDATQFSQGFAQGMRAIGNNIALTLRCLEPLEQELEVL